MLQLQLFRVGAVFYCYVRRKSSDPMTKKLCVHVYKIVYLCKRTGSLGVLAVVHWMIYVCFGDLSSRAAQWSPGSAMAISRLSKRCHSTLLRMTA